MDLAVFYALVSGTGFTLVGLWWSVVDKRPEWRQHPLERRLAGGVYISFLLPATMSLIAQINPDRPVFWRTSFVASALVGLYFTTRLLSTERESGRSGWLGRNPWVAGVLYVIVGVLGAAPELASLLGLRPLEAGAIVLVALVLVAHALTWEFVMERDEAPPVPKS